MTYDDWKLETPEDEAIRKGLMNPRYGWRKPPEVCPNCGEDFIEDMSFCCSECCIDPTIDDPDDARDDMQDREWNR